MNAYFAGSILGGNFPGKREAYDMIIRAIEARGITIISQHGAVNPKAEMEKLTPTQIYDIDMSWLKQADILIAEITAGSNGVGYEIGAAVHEFHTPVLCLHQQAIPSAMMQGNQRVITRRYSMHHDIEWVLDEFLAMVGSGYWEWIKENV